MDEKIKEFIDLDAALARVRGNKALYCKMLGMFLKSVEFDAFEEAMTQQELSKAADVIHSIKGMTGNLGLNPLFESSTQLMDQLRKGSCEEGTLQRYRENLAATRSCVEAFLAQQ